MSQLDQGTEPLVSAETVRRLEAGERVTVSGVELSAQLCVVMLTSYDVDESGRWRDGAVDVIAERLSGLVARGSARAVRAGPSR